MIAQLQNVDEEKSSHELLKKHQLERVSNYLSPKEFND